MKFLSSFIFLCLTISCSEVYKRSLVDSQANVKFYIEDSLIKLQDDFEMIFFVKNEQLKSHIIGNKVYWEVNKNIEDGVFRMEFSRNKYRVYIDSIPGYILLNDMKADFIVGIDTFPIDNMKGLIKKVDYDSNKTVKQINYIQINPMEEGIGRIFTKIIK